MFDTIVIHASPDKAAVLRALAAASGDLQILRELTTLPGAYELSRLLNTLSPDLVLIDLAVGHEALQRVAQIAEHSPQTAVVGYGADASLALAAQQRGVHAVVPLNGRVADLRIAVRDALHSRHGGVEPGLFSFLPSKAGSGSSTVVLNTATALARFHQKRVLVIDADLRSGILAIMLDVEPQGSIQTILRGIDSLSSLEWSRCVIPLHGVDYLLSSRSLDTHPPEWSHYYQLLNFAREHYDAILVDLPELVNAASVELVRRSAMVFPVCTPEIPSLRLTQQRCAELDRWGVPQERVGIVLNRWHASDPAPAELTRILGRPVLKALPNDYPALRAAVAAGTPVSFDSKLGKSFVEFAGRLIQDPSAEPEAGLAGRLLGWFGISHA